MICTCGEHTELENDTETVWNADGDVGYHSYCAYPCSSCDGMAVTENPNGTWSCADCEVKQGFAVIREAMDRLLEHTRER